MTGFPLAANAHSTGAGLPENLDQNGNVVSFMNNGQNVPLAQPYDYSNVITHSFEPSPMERSQPVTNLFVYKVLPYTDATTDQGSNSIVKPKHWGNGTAIFKTWWMPNATHSARDIVVAFKLMAATFSASAANTLYEVTQTVTLGTTLQATEITWDMGAMTFAPYNILGVRVRRVGADVADTFTSTVYYMGGELTFVPKGQ
jgi:hypothetical protein